MVKTISIRFPDEVHAQLKDEYARTYAQHRLSFNNWLLAVVNVGLEQGTFEWQVA